MGLLKNAEKFRRLFESKWVGIIVTDTDGNITEANDFFLSLFGYSRDDLPLPWDATMSEWRCLDRVKIAEVLTTGDASLWEKDCIGKGGRAVHVLIGMALLVETGRECIGIVLDHTNRRQTEQQLVQSKIQLRALTVALLQVEEQERRRIARGLHDDISQTLAIVKGKIGALRRGMYTGCIDQLVEDTQALIDQAIKTTRALTFELSSPVLYELGLAAALQSLGEQMAQEHNLHYQFANSFDRPIAKNLGLVLYRIARELLRNVVSHAQARLASITLNRVGGQLHLTVKDDGVGFVAIGTGNGSNERKGFGLFSVRQQLEHIGGHLDIHSSPGDGTRVVVVVPWADESRVTAL